MKKYLLFLVLLLSFGAVMMAATGNDPPKYQYEYSMDVPAEVAVEVAAIGVQSTDFILYQTAPEGCYRGVIVQGEGILEEQFNFPNIHSSNFCPTINSYDIHGMVLDKQLTDTPTPRTVSYTQLGYSMWN